MSLLGFVFIISGERVVPIRNLCVPDCLDARRVRAHRHAEIAVLAPIRAPGVADGQRCSAASKFFSIQDFMYQVVKRGVSQLDNFEGRCFPKGDMPIGID